MRILLLDDIDARRVILEERLSPAEFVHATNASEAITALQGERFDLVHLDHDLGEEPAGTGAEVARAIAELPPERRPLRAVIHSFNPVGAQRMKAILEDAEVPTELKPFSSPRL